MCVAVVVNDESPTVSELQDMEISNPHGAGLAWADAARGGVAYKKGLDALEVFKILQDLPRPALLHFRWATHGPRVPRLCHPFPLGAKAILSTQLEGVARNGVLIHNGVWSGHRKYAPKWLDMDQWSDTAVGAFMALEKPELLKDMSWATATGKLGEDGKLEVSRTGGWSEHNGNMYSNMSWQRTKKYSPATLRYLKREAVEEQEDDTVEWESVNWDDMEWDGAKRAFVFKGRRIV